MYIKRTKNKYLKILQQYNRQVINNIDYKLQKVTFNTLEPIPLPQINSTIVLKEPELDQFEISDGVQLAVRIWKGKIGRPVVVYLHGIEGHSQWFQNTASVLNQYGITVYAPDRRGSGINAHERGHLPSHKIYLADVEMLLARLAAEYRDRSLILIGNCWGAKTAAIVARDDYKPVTGCLNFQIAGLVLTCPAIYTKVDFDLSTKLMVAYSWLKGGHSALRRWQIPLAPSMFTDNQDYLNYVVNDPLRLQEATASFWVATANLSRLAQQSASHIRMPLLLLQSGDDCIVDIDGVKSWYVKIKALQKSMRIFPGAAHSIDFDANWFEEYTQQLVRWVLGFSRS